MTDIREKYTQDYSYYEIRYDRILVEQCRWIEDVYNKTLQQLIKERKEEGDLKKERGDIYRIHHIILMQAQVESWKKKSETIDQWMQVDKAREDLYENAVEPSGVLCEECSSTMTSDFKTLETWHDKNRVLFFFDCPNKHRGRAIYDNGEERVSDPKECIQCHGINLSHKSKRKKKAISITYTCEDCKNVEYEEIDLTETKIVEPVDDQFEYDRERFCLNEATAPEAVEAIDGLMWIAGLAKEMEEKKQNKALHQLIDSIQRLTIPQVEKIILEAIKDSQLVKLSFEKPEFTGDVVVPFTIYDESERDARESVMALQKILKKALAKTNWALFAKAPSYRMGMLSGSLRGVESEDAIKKLVEKRLKAKDLKLPKVVGDDGDDEPGIVYTQDRTKVTL